MATLKKQNGFSVIELMAVLVIGAFLLGVGWFVYSSNQEATNTYDSLAGKSDPSSSARDRIVAAGDIACDPGDPHFSGTDSGYCQSEKTHALATSLKPDAILALGDLQYENGALDKFARSYDKHWGQAKNITHPVPGNHEYGTAGAAGYFSYFNGSRNTGPAGDSGKGYYSFGVGDWHLVALNSNCDDVGGCTAGSPQYKWLEQNLKTTSAACTLAFWHHPRFTSGKYESDKSTTDRTTQLWDLLLKNKADIVLAGHDHLYERFALQDSNGRASDSGIRQFTVGTGGKALYQHGAIQAGSEKLIDDQFGILSLDLYPKAYNWQFITVEGKVLDSGHSSCNL